MVHMEGPPAGDFDDLYSKGVVAKENGDHELAMRYFYYANVAASRSDDRPQQLKALNPLARAFWNLGQYDKAEEVLDSAFDIACELKLDDWQAIVISNLGRLAAVKMINTVSTGKQAKALRAEATPRFEGAFELLRDHPHLYFRYANASHGSVVAALASNRMLARSLIEEGLEVATQVSTEDYGHEIPAEVNPSGIKQLNMAKVLVPLGGRTPIYAELARQKFVR